MSGECDKCCDHPMDCKIFGCRSLETKCTDCNRTVNTATFQSPEHHAVLRIEDMGRIHQLLIDLLDNHGDFFDQVGSKHQYDSFINKYSSEEELYNLFYKIRHVHENILDVFEIVRGDHRIQ